MLGMLPFLFWRFYLVVTFQKNERVMMRDYVSKYDIVYLTTLAVKYSHLNHWFSCGIVSEFESDINTRDKHGSSCKCYAISSINVAYTSQKSATFRFRLTLPKYIVKFDVMVSACMVRHEIGATLLRCGDTSIGLNCACKVRLNELVRLHAWHIREFCQFGRGATNE